MLSDVAVFVGLQESQVSVQDEGRDSLDTGLTQEGEGGEGFTATIGS
ncbi:MAG: hypothetical protein RI897_3632 [Verrucomicrobiota bacterium]